MATERIEFYDREGVDRSIPAKFGVCGRCRGEGKHDNPNFSDGFTADDFAEDPDFAEDYLKGVYDVTCLDCKGLRVVLVPDENTAKKEDLEAYNDSLQEEAEIRAEEAAERRAGA